MEFLSWLMTYILIGIDLLLVAGAAVTIGIVSRILMDKQKAKKAAREAAEEAELEE
jgi:hypothetical protein